MMRLDQVIYLGLANWIATLIITSSRLFAPVRAAAAAAHPKLGELMSCPLCAGTWVGFFQALVLGGPIPSRWVLDQILWNGLLYKAVAEFVGVMLNVVQVDQERRLSLHTRGTHHR